MSKSVQSQISMSYRVYDLNNLRKSDDKEALIATYPDIEDEPICHDGWTSPVFD